MTLSGWIRLVGLVGWLASMITGRNDRQGCLMSIVAGIDGAANSSATVGIYGAGRVTGFNLGS